jgi:hypothetical protein
MITCFYEVINMQKVLSVCPSCGGDLKISALTCPDCGIEVRGQFNTETSPFCALSAEQTDFLLLFLKCRGNMKQLQAELQIAYPTARKKLNEVLSVLGLYAEVQDSKESKDIVDVGSWNIDEGSMKASDIIKRKLREHGGRALVTSYSGKEYEVWAEVDGTTFGCDALHGTSHSYDIFDVVVGFLERNGGRAKKGTGRAPLGTEKCGLDTVSGVILHDYFGVPIGGSGFDPSFVVAAILEWAGIAKNERGWLELC